MSMTWGLETEDHLDDDGEACDCQHREARLEETEDDYIVHCPKCDSTEHSLVCGDHGNRCDDCGTRFTVC